MPSGPVYTVGEFGDTFVTMRHSWILTRGRRPCVVVGAGMKWMTMGLWASWWASRVAGMMLPVPLWLARRMDSEVPWL